MEQRPTWLATFARAADARRFGVNVMIEKLTAAEVVTLDDEEYWTVAFRDGARRERYFLIQRAKVTSPQDEPLGTNTYYIERNDQKYSCYGGLATLELRPDAIAVDLDEEGSAHLDVKSLLLQFSLNSRQFQEFRQALRQVFAGTSCLIEAGAQPGARGDAREA